MLVYRDQSTGALDQSIGGCPRVLCRFSAGISRLVVPVSRLMVILRVWQSTDGARQSTGTCPETSPVEDSLEQSTGRLGRVLERVFKQVSTMGINGWDWFYVFYMDGIVPRGYKRVFWDNLGLYVA